MAGLGVTGGYGALRVQGGSAHSEDPITSPKSFSSLGGVEGDALSIP